MPRASRGLRALAYARSSTQDLDSIFAEEAVRSKSRCSTTFDDSEAVFPATVFSAEA
jgi:hypothetical protein